MGHANEAPVSHTLFNLRIDPVIKEAVRIAAQLDITRWHPQQRGLAL